MFGRTPQEDPARDGWQQRGNECLARGALGEAIRCYRAAADADPNDAAARLSLGFALLEQQSVDEARQWLQQVLRLQPAQHEAHFLLARAARAQGALEMAAGHYADAVRHAPGFEPAQVEGAEVCVEVGQQQLEANATQAARDWFVQAVQRHPASAAAHAHLGLACESLGRMEAAERSYQEALFLLPCHPQALFGLGNVCMHRNDPAAAAAHYRGVLDALPDHALAQANLAQALLQAGRFGDALQRFRRLRLQDPGEPAALLGEANALLGLGQHEEALAAYDRALQALPTSALAHLNRGNALLALRRREEALESFRRAVQQRPGYVEALVNIGGVLHDQCRFGEAVQVFEQALAQDPANAAAQWNRGLCLLVEGDLERGWPGAEWRWQVKGLRRLQTGRPQWTGAESLEGKTIFVHYEQGLGDTVQFCRYVPMLEQRGATVLLAVQPSLERLLRTMPGRFQLVPVGAAIPEHDYECPLLSLPLAFRTTLQSIPAAPYLASRPPLVAAWRERLGDASGRRVGIVWSGNPAQENDQNRSIPLATLAGIAGPGVQLVSLQKDVRAGDRPALDGVPILHFGDLLTDFEQTAALVECMDVVVSVCTSVAHVAAALGKPTWVLLCFGADWRWLRGRADSPWYPSARLFRQPRPGAWASVVTEVREALQA